MADLYYTQASLEGITSVTSEESLLQVYQSLETNLSSAYSKVSTYVHNKLQVCHSKFITSYRCTKVST